MRGSRSLMIPLVTLVLGIPAAHAQYTAKEWPDGPSKARFTETCGVCHDINRVRVGYTPEGWLTVVRMMQNMQAPVPAEEWGAMTDYLIKNFPERKRPPAAIVDGPVKVEIKMWDVPTQGSRPHDPLAARDGSIWWTGQLVNKLGRLDPKTGAIKEYTLKSAFTGPHGLAEDKSGNIWFTGNNTALIGKLDPATGIVTEYPLPDANARDPHTLNFDQSGILWFTVQQANIVGRLDPATGAIKLLTSPTPKSRPYGLHINARGIPVFVEFGANKIATIDPATLAIKEYALPNPDARPRRLAIDPDGMVWYVDFARGYLGWLDLATGAVSEWPLAIGREVRALRHRLHQGRGLVQRIRGQAEHDRAFRSAQQPIPELGDTGRRRYRAQYGRHPRRQSRDRRQPDQPGRAGRDQVGRAPTAVFSSWPGLSRPSTSSLRK